MNILKHSPAENNRCLSSTGRYTSRKEKKMCMYMKKSYKQIRKIKTFPNIKIIQFRGWGREPPFLKIAMHTFQRRKPGQILLFIV